MSINKWFHIWSNRNTNFYKKINLEDLIFFNGFDSPLGRMNKNDWLSYIDQVRLNCDITHSDSIFEVGCGSGAFLLPFFNAKHLVSGIDYSKKLVLIANKAIHNEIKVCKAHDLEVETKFDLLFSNHVFHYFKTIEYSLDVLKKMFIKCNKKVVILGLPDNKFKIDSELARRGILSENEYKKKYKDLDILYFDKKDFINFAKTNNAKIEFFDHNMPGFKQNKFRFDCIISKK